MPASRTGITGSDNRKYIANHHKDPTMGAELIDLRIQAGIATLRLNRPDKRNALNDELRNQLADGLERIASDKDVRALVLTGNGESFCAGGDVAAMKNRLD